MGSDIKVVLKSTGLGNYESTCHEKGVKVVGDLFDDSGHLKNKELLLDVGMKR